MTSAPAPLRLFAALCAACAVAACSGDKEPNLLNIRANTPGPDEFAILPNKPLQQPDSYAALPPPTPGGRNLADPNPMGDAYAALGGSAAALSGGVDAGLYGYVTRYGVRPGIRAELARADLQYRKDNDGRFLERVFNVNVYFDAYRPYALDQYAELARLRAAGVRTPSVPPEPAQ